MVGASLKLLYTQMEDFRGLFGGDGVVAGGV